MDEKDVRKGLGFPEKDPDYPPELKTATRAEFTTGIRIKNKKKPGCPLTVLSVLLILASAILIIQLIVQ